MRFPQLGLLDEFPPEEQHRKQADHEVAEQEGRYIPVTRQKDSISSNESHDEGANRTDPSGVGLADRDIGQRAQADALGFESPTPAKESAAGDAVVDELCRRD